MAWGVVLHPESSGGAIPGVHRWEAGEAGQLVMGLCQNGEAQGGSHRGGALKAREERSQWGAGVSHPVPPPGHAVGGEGATDVDVRWPYRPRPHVVGGSTGRRGLESHWPGATAEAQ